MMRIFKLARRSVGLQSMAHTVKTSWKDLGLLFSLVIMGMLFYGSLEYFIENGEEDTGFYSIPQVGPLLCANDSTLLIGNVVGCANPHLSWLWRLQSHHSAG